MSEIQVKKLVYSFCQALSMKNTGKLNDLLTENSSLSWGPYDFDGKEKILEWAIELFELFPFMSFKEKSLEVTNSIARHEFMIAFLTTEGRKGWIPCEADYNIKDDHITQIKVKLLHGFLSVSKDEVEKVRPH